MFSLVSAEVEDADDAVMSLAHCDTYGFNLKSVKSGTTNLGNFSSTNISTFAGVEPGGLAVLPLVVIPRRPLGGEDAERGQPLTPHRPSERAQYQSQRHILLLLSDDSRAARGGPDAETREVRWFA